MKAYAAARLLGLAIGAAAPVAVAAQTASTPNLSNASLTSDSINTASPGFHLRSSLAYAQFLSEWQGYDNRVADLTLQPSFQSSRFQARADLRLSQERRDILLGNIEMALWHISPQFSIGRQSATVSYLPAQLSVHDRLNQRVCVTAFDCYSGGPIGTHANFGWLAISASILSLPNLDPRPHFDSAGRIESSNRWAVPPVQEVRVGNDTFPLRNSTEVIGGAKIYLKPGLRIKFQGENPALGAWSFTNAVEYAKKAQASADQGLGFGATASGTEVVVQNAVRLNYSYENIHSFQNRYLSSWGSFFNEYSYAHAYGSNLESGLSGIETTTHNFQFQIGAGFLHKTYWDPVLSASVYGHVRSLRTGAQVFALTNKNRQAIHLRPSLEWQIRKSLSVYVLADLIRAQEKAPFFSDIAGDDRVVSGLRYAF